MRRFLEYATASGRIICEVYADDEPQVEDGHAVLEISGDMTLDTNNCAVVDGVLTRMYETPDERVQREKLRREYKERTGARVRRLMYDFLIAQIEEDDVKIRALREEYNIMKRWM